MEKKKKNTIESFDCAFNGLRHALKTQRHMQLHIVLGAVVVFLALWLKLTKVETLIVLIAVSLVLVAEMFNTAVEVAIDLFIREHHPLAAVAKNVAAGAVLVTAANAFVVGYIVFVPSLNAFLPSVFERVRSSPPYLSLAALVLVTTMVIVLKSLNRSRSIMRGGMPSGHTAVACALSTAIIFLSNYHPTVTFLAILLALLVAESRLETKIHSLMEVLVGGAVGLTLTIVVFQFLYRFGR